MGPYLANTGFDRAFASSDKGSMHGQASDHPMFTSAPIFMSDHPVPVTQIHDPTP